MFFQFMMLDKYISGTIFVYVFCIYQMCSIKSIRLCMYLIFLTNFMDSMLDAICNSFVLYMLPDLACCGHP